MSGIANKAVPFPGTTMNLHINSLFLCLICTYIHLAGECLFYCVFLILPFCLWFYLTGILLC